MTDAAAPPIVVGRVRKPHGLKGELRVEPFFEGSDALEQVSELWLSRQAETAEGALPHVIEWARPVPRAYLVKLEGVSERNGAEADAGDEGQDVADDGGKGGKGHVSPREIRRAIRAAGRRAEW